LKERNGSRSYFNPHCPEGQTFITAFFAAKRKKYQQPLSPLGDINKTTSFKKVGERNECRQATFIYL